MWHPRHREADNEGGMALNLDDHSLRLSSTGVLWCKCDVYDINAWCDHVSGMLLRNDPVAAPILVDYDPQHAPMWVPVHDVSLIKGAQWAWIDVYFTNERDGFWSAKLIGDRVQTHEVGLVGPWDNVMHVARLLRMFLDNKQCACKSKYHKEPVTGKVRDKAAPLSRLDKLWVVTLDQCIACYEKESALMSAVNDS